MRPFARYLAVALALFALAAPAPAAFIIRAETVTAAAGSSGFVQVLLDNTGPNTLQLSGFSADLTLGGPGVVFTGVDTGTTPPHVFGPLGSGTLTFSPFPNTGFILSDFVNTPPLFAVVAPGTTVGLGRIAFTVDAGAASGLRPLTIAAGPTTELSDQTNSPISGVLLTNGGINVQGGLNPVLPTPAPPTALLAVLGAASMGGLQRFRRRTA